MIDHLADAVRRVVDSHVAVWRYSTVFDQLWRWEVPASYSAAVILWDKTGDQDTSAISLREFVSPVSWVICFNEHRRMEGQRPFSVLVIDLSTELTETSIAGLAATQTLTWLHVIRREAWATSAEHLRHLEQPENLGAAFGLLRNQLAFSVIEGAGDVDYHHVANHLGPALLLPRWVTSKLATHRAVLVAVEILVGSVKRKAEVTASEGASLNHAQRAVDTIGGLDILLIDDQSRASPSGSPGWETVLRERLTQLSSLSFVVRDSPSDLLKTVEERLAQAPTIATAPMWVADSRESRRRNGGVCFLDLRLFDKQPENELKFFRRLLPSAKLVTKTRANLPWQGIDSREVESIAEWLHEITARAVPDESRSYRKDRTYLAALSLFPRLVALADFTLPVVIFTSSRQAEIERLLRPYGNIVATVAKPRFDRVGYTEDLVAQFTDSLERAILAVVRWANGANAYRVACRAASNQTPWSLKNFVSTTGKAPTIAFYLDETGSPKESNSFAVGGCCVVYPSRNAVDDVDRIEKHSITVNDETISTCFGPSETSKGLPKPTHFLKKRAPETVRTAARSALSQRIRDKGATEFTIAVRQSGLRQLMRRPQRLVPNESGVGHLRRADNFALRMIRELVEAILWAIAPAVSEELVGTSDRPPSLWIFYANRIHKTSDLSEREYIEKALGLEVKLETISGQRVLVYHSVTPSSFPLITTEAAFEQPLSLSNKFNFHRSPGVRLPYFCTDTKEDSTSSCSCVSRDGGSGSLPRQVHYFADWDLGEPTHSVDIERQAGFACWLNANRAAASGRKSSALYWASKAALTGGGRAEECWYPASFRKLLESVVGADLVEYGHLAELAENGVGERDVAREHRDIPYASPSLLHTRGLAPSIGNDDRAPLSSQRTEGVSGSKFAGNEPGSRTEERSERGLPPPIRRQGAARVTISGTLAKIDGYWHVRTDDGELVVVSKTSAQRVRAEHIGLRAQFRRNQRGDGYVVATVEWIAGGHLRRRKS